MRLDADAEGQLSRLFEGGVAAVDVPVDGFAPSLSTTPLLEGAGTSGALLLVSQADDLRARIERARRCVHPGGPVALLHPTSAAGLRGAVRRLFGPRGGVMLEDGCEALLLARLGSVRAESVGRDGWLAWGRVRSARAQGPL